MPIRAVVFDIGGIFEIIPEGGDPSARYPGMAASWDVKLGREPGTLGRQFDELAARLAAEGKDGGIGTCTAEEYFTALQAITGMDDATYAAFQRDFWDTYMGYPNTEMMAYFRALRPRYRTALLSNSFVGAREEEEARFRYSELAEFIVYSHECGCAKPDARIYELTYTRLGVQPAEMLFLDDNPHNVAAAQALGIHAVHYRDNAQAIAELEALLSEPGA